MQQSTTRVVALDGLRGWAALSVVVFHFVIETFGQKFPDLRTWLPFLYNGKIAVMLFFVLSGYVLTRGRWRRGNAALAHTLVARYLRLSLPILAVSLLACLVMRLGLADTTPAAGIVGRPGWLGGFARFTASLPGAIQFALVGTYGPVPTESYNPFLWTMIVEFWGSLAVITLSHFRLPDALPYLLLVGLLVLSLLVYAAGAGIVLGALIALAETDRGSRSAEPGSRLLSVLGIVAFATALAFAWMIWDLDWSYSLSLPAAGVMMLATLYCAPVRAFFSTPLSQRLGRLSFPLYLVQYVVLIALTPHLIVFADAMGSLDLPVALAIAGVSLAATFGLAVVFLPVETLTAQIVRRIRGTAAGGRQATPASLGTAAR
jgi:peptidoglycan/LPS O-acetylase OafA/YrhL